MARILIVNLTRFGDLLETQPLIHDLVDSGHSVGLLCLDNFVTAVPLIQGLSGAWPLRGSRLLADLDQDWHRALAGARTFAAELREGFAPDAVINLTASLSARLLSLLVAPAPEKVAGFAIDNYGFGIHRGVWTLFFCGQARQRAASPFNVADLFRKIGASYIKPQILASPGRNRLCLPDDAAVCHARSLLATAGLPDGQRFVAFQPGASAAIRQWPVAHFARLGDLLWQKAQICPVLLGTGSESHLGTEYAALANSPHVNAIGKTNLAELAALLLQCQMLVTNDTGTMHLAAGLGLPSLAFFLATAQPCDTGPYLPGCCCLEPAMPCHPCPYSQTCPTPGACSHLVKPDAVAKLALARLAGQEWESGVGPELASQARVWLTATGPDGFATVHCISGHADADRSRWLALQRHFWGNLLRALEDANLAAPGQTQTLPEMGNAPPPPDGLVAGILPVASQVTRLLAMLGEQATLLHKSSMAGGIFLRNCDRVGSLLDSCPPLAAIGTFWAQLVQDRGGSLQELTGPLEIMRMHLLALVRHLELALPGQK